MCPDCQRKHATVRCDPYETDFTFGKDRVATSFYYHCTVEGCDGFQFPPSWVEPKQMTTITWGDPTPEETV